MLYLFGKFRPEGVDICWYGYVWVWIFVVWIFGDVDMFGCGVCVRRPTLEIREVVSYLMVYTHLATAMPFGFTS